MGSKGWNRRKAFMLWMCSAALGSMKQHPPQLGGFPGVAAALVTCLLWLSRAQTTLGVGPPEQWDLYLIAFLLLNSLCTVMWASFPSPSFFPKSPSASPAPLSTPLLFKVLLEGSGRCPDLAHSLGLWQSHAGPDPSLATVWVFFFVSPLPCFPGAGRCALLDVLLRSCLTLDG